MAKKFNFDGKGLDDIFQHLVSHQVSALMLHSSMVELFNFLGLKGFKRWQKYRVIDEYDGYRGICAFYQETYNKLNPKPIPQDLDVVPSDWYKYSRFDVTQDARKRMIETAFTKWHDWESETLEFLQTIICRLDELGDVMASDFVHELLKDVQHEVIELEKMLLELKATGYDMTYIVSIQKCIHDKYKKKM